MALKKTKLSKESCGYDWVSTHTPSSEWKQLNSIQRLYKWIAKIRLFTLHIWQQRWWRAKKCCHLTEPRSSRFRWGTMKCCHLTEPGSPRLRWEEKKCYHLTVPGSPRLRWEEKKCCHLTVPGSPRLRWEAKKCCHLTEPGSPRRSCASSHLWQCEPNDRIPYHL